MRIYVVGMQPLDDPPSAGAIPEAAFCSRESAMQWGETNGHQLMGTRHWWGEVSQIDQTYAIWELEMDRD